MRSTFSSLAASPAVSRLAIGAMLLAIIALGALAVWANMVSQGHLRDLSHSGVQTSGQLRAVQALGQIDNYADILEDGIDPKVLAQLRSAQRVLSDSLGRMQRTSFDEWQRRNAREAEPELERLTPAVDAFLAAVPRGDVKAQDVAEQHMQDILDEMQLRFNDIRRDPSGLLLKETSAAADGNRMIDRAALVLLPLALLSVGLGGWLLTTSRKRGDAERERMGAELRLAQRLEAVGHLAAGVAHEINTPMQFVGDSVRFIGVALDELRELSDEYKAIGVSLAAGRDDEPAIRERIRAAEERADLEYLDERVPAAFARTQDGVQRVMSIVAAMRDFSRPRETEQTAADLNAAIRSTLTIAQNEYKYVADVETEFGEIPLVTCNVSEINQVFLNLIVNAAHAIGDATPPDRGERGTIRVATARDNGSVVVTVSDSGPGIPHDIRERIFDPFFTTKDVGKGTGQGLAIASSIVDRHGGALTLDVDPATTFVVRLPIG